MSNVEIKLFDVSNLIERKCKKQKKTELQGKKVVQRE